MVIRAKCKDGTERIDWFKTIVSMTILGTIVLLGLNLSIESNARSKETAIEMRMTRAEMIEFKKETKEGLAEMNKNINRLMERK